MSPPTDASAAADTTTMVVPPSWTDLETQIGGTPVGQAMNHEVELRRQGHGSAHVQNTLRLFDNAADNNINDNPSFNEQGEPRITLYRDHAGWCPYCQKTMLLVEEKKIPLKIELVPMRSYGDKPVEYTRMVPGGLLPAITIDMPDGRKQVITESQVIMELLDQWHTPADGYKPMLPSTAEGMQRYQQLARLERDLFSWWCTLVFRPEQQQRGGGGIMGGGAGGLMGMLTGNNNKNIQQQQQFSGAMQGFLDCLQKVDAALLETEGPWFFDTKDMDPQNFDGNDENRYNYPTMIDFIYVSHVERMLASCAYWKGLDIRKSTDLFEFKGINAWLEAFEQREGYLAFKSDYYTHIKDIPPQYGPGFDGGFEEKRQEFSRKLLGKDGKSWNLPLPHDDYLEPLYNGPPLPLCVLNAMDLKPDANGKYVNCDPETMAEACRQMAAWKLTGNGMKVAKFASRGGPGGAKNARKSFDAPLADPYAAPDEELLPLVDEALRVVCMGLHDSKNLESFEIVLHSNVDGSRKQDVANSLAYLRDRVGVPRDLPLASARYLRAHLNWAIDVLMKT